MTRRIPKKQWFFGTGIAKISRLCLAVPARNALTAQRQGAVPSGIHRHAIYFSGDMMTARSLFAGALLLCGSLALALPDCAEAARMGGGRSFGGKPFMSTPAPAPRPQATQPGVNQAQPRQQQAAAATATRPGGMFGGMGGLFGGLLAGTLLGSLLSGNGFSGGGFMDILLFGLLIFLGLKLFAAFRNRQNLTQASASAGAHGSSGMYRESAGQNGWDALRAQPPSGAGLQGAGSAQPAVPQGFDVEDFLRGAKMVYNRLQEAWDKRDVSDIAQFATQAVQDEVRGQMQDDPHPSRTEILLVNAQLLSVEEEEGNQYAQVFFDVLLRERPDQETPSSAREIWHFVRPTAGGNWKLDGIQQVS